MKTSILRALVCMVAGVGFPAGWALAQGLEVLNAQTRLRHNISWRTAATEKDGQTDLGRGHLVTTGTRWVKNDFDYPTPPPPEGWMAPDFDDSGWPRRSGTLPSGYSSYPNDAYLLCARAYFGVTDPAKAVGLKLNLVYRGGVVVYLNGSEVARADLPAGKIEPLTLASPYAPEAFQGAGGAVLPVVEGHGRGDGPPANLAAHYKKRDRTLSIELPAGKLKAGSNTLAIEVHRTIVPAEAAAGGKAFAGTCAIVSLTLTAPAGSAVQPNTAPPAGVSVWTCDPLVRGGSDLAAGDPFEPVRPLVLATPRNGVSSGQVVVSSPTTLPAVTATLTDLKSEAGAVAPASCVQIRYATTAAPFPALMDKPVSAPVQPIWLTARPPRNVAAGVYRGTLSIAGLEKPATVAVELRISGWMLPDFADYNTSVSLLQSPESVAGFYGVPLWSDKHFALLEKSLAVGGYAGNRLVSVSAIGEDLFGDHPAIVFRKEGNDYIPDLAFARRYLEIQNKVAGAPRQLSVQIWNYSISRRGHGRDGGKEKWIAKTLKVRLLEGGKLVPAEMPIYTEPGTEKTWAAVASGMRQIMKDLGWNKTYLLWGTGGDNLPNPEIVEFFKKIDPAIHWRVATHGGACARWGLTTEERTQSGGLVLGYVNLVRRNIARRPLVAECPFDSLKRDGAGSSPQDYMTLATLARLAAHYSGFGFVPLDYWAFTTAQGTQRNPLGAYVGFGNIGAGSPRACVVAGPEGALPTPQVEALREGLQINEAALYLRGLINDPARAAAIKPEQAEEIRTTVQAMVDVMESNRRMSPMGGADVRWLIRRVYELAGEAGQ